MNNSDFFCFIKSALTAASKFGFTHQPEHDRYIDGMLTLAFSRAENNLREAAVDMTFDMDAQHVLNTGVCKYKNMDGSRELKCSDFNIRSIDDVFNLRIWATYSK